MLLRIFKTLGTPQFTDFNENPTLSSEQICPWFFVNYDKFPIWQGMKMEELLPPGTSVVAIDLIKRMLEVEPTKRISADKALTHEFFYDI